MSRQIGGAVSGDARGWRIALVPDALINPPDRIRAALPDVMRVLEAGGYGVLHLPRPASIACCSP